MVWQFIDILKGLGGLGGILSLLSDVLLQVSIEVNKCLLKANVADLTVIGVLSCVAGIVLRKGVKDLVRLRAVGGFGC